MSRGFAEEETHDVCKVCDYAIRNEECPGCGFGFESFSIKEHDAEIRRQTLKEVESAMHREAFYIDHEIDGMQKWDGGNWIRYKLFEKVMEQIKGES